MLCMRIDVATSSPINRSTPGGNTTTAVVTTSYRYKVPFVARMGLHTQSRRRVLVRNKNDAVILPLKIAEHTTIQVALCKYNSSS